LRHREVEQLTLAGRNSGELERLAERMRGRAEVRLATFDITKGELAQHAGDHDRVVSCAGPGYQLEASCVDAAIGAGVDYISLNDDIGAAREIRERHDDAIHKQVTIVSGCGASPGLTDLLVALASEGLDEVHEVEISFAASSADGGGPATDLHFIAMLDRAARDGSDETDGGARAPQPVYFPDPVGWIETFPCRHPEELSVARNHPGATAFRFRIGLAEKAVMDVVRAGIATRLTSGDLRRKLWLRSAAPVRPLLEKLSPKAAPWTGLRVDVRGRQGSRSKTVSYGVVDHLVNLASITLAQAAVELPPGAPYGVLTADDVFEPRAFLRKAAARGLTFARLEPHQL
jgi:saccharopine dehydrogenase-like NADP-dependent oxidoreductase